MRTTLSILAMTAIGATFLTTGGCVSMDKYKEALAANRRVNEELDSCQSQLQAQQADNEQLSQQVDELGQSVQAKDAQVDSLQKENDLLRSSMRELRDRVERLSQLEPPAVVSIRLPEHVHEALQEFAADNPEMVEYLPRYGMVKFRADLTFEKGSDQVREQAAETLKKLVAVLKEPEVRRFHVYVAGHTDDIPIVKPETKKRHPNNWYLAAHRAVAVQETLEEGGLAPERIGIMAFGKYHPIAPNKPAQGGNPRNRRVEIWIVPPDRFLTVSAPVRQK